MILRSLLLLSLSLIAACGDAAQPPSRPTASAPAEVEVVRFEIQGMSCEGCVAAITAAVKELEGVGGCEVSLAEKGATVNCTDPSAPERIIARVTRMGYTVARTPANGSSATPAH